MESNNENEINKKTNSEQCHSKLVYQAKIMASESAGRKQLLIA
jgi:hypothetical protein